MCLAQAELKLELEKERNAAEAKGKFVQGVMRVQAEVYR